MPKHYSISSYDKNLCLKPNATILLIVLFLIRPYLVLVLSIVNIKDRSALIDMVYPDRLVMSLSALAGVPAAVFLYALLKRKPRASDFVKKVWRRGRIILATSALLGAVGIFVPLWLGKLYKLVYVDWLQFGLSLLVVVVVYQSEYIRDCLNDFPSDEEVEKK